MYKALKQTVRKYYKYIYTTWTQPVLSSNGTIGGNSFACTASSALPDSDPTNRRGPVWFAFNGSNAFAWHSSQGFPQWIEFYNPIALKVTNLKIQNWTYPASTGMGTGKVEGSNDNSTWTQLTTFNNSSTGSNAEWNIDLTSNTDLYKYYRIVCTSSSYNNYAVIGEIDITGYTQSIQESTPQDYDFYKDVDIYSTYITNNTYKALRS